MNDTAYLSFEQAVALAHEARLQGVQVDSVEMRHPDSVLLDKLEERWYVLVRFPGDNRNREVYDREGLEVYMRITAACGHKAIEITEAPDTHPSQRLVVARCTTCGLVLDPRANANTWLANELVNVLIQARDALRTQEYRAEVDKHE